jgi:hypothetical protein
MLPSEVSKLIDKLVVASRLFVLLRLNGEEVALRTNVLLLVTSFVQSVYV